MTKLIMMMRNWEWRFVLANRRYHLFPPKLAWHYQQSDRSHYFHLIVPAQIRWRCFHSLKRLSWLDLTFSHNCCYCGNLCKWLFLDCNHTCYESHQGSLTQALSYHEFYVFFLFVKIHWFLLVRADGILKKQWTGMIWGLTQIGKIKTFPTNSMRTFENASISFHVLVKTLKNFN